MSSSAPGAEVVVNWLTGASLRLTCLPPDYVFSVGELSEPGSRMLSWDYRR
jgi:hypothetical protein